MLGRSWYFLDPPQHLSYFTASGLARFVERHGFSGSVRLKRFGRWVSLANVAFKLSHHAPSSTLRRLAHGLVRRRLGGAVYVNFGDAMLLVASRCPAEAR